MSDSSSIRSNSQQNTSRLLKKVKMGKKAERAFRGEKLPQASESSFENNKEISSLSGQFSNDFNGVCRNNSINNPPPIVNRPRRPASPGNPQKGSAQDSGPGAARMKQKQIQQQQAQQHEEEDLSPEDKEIVDLFGFKPKTFLVKNTQEYMRPTIQVEMENPDKQDTVTEIVIRGWLMEENLLSALCLCFPVMSKLHTITFWRVGLTSERVFDLATALKQCEHIKVLNIDSNDSSSPPHNYHELIREDSHLTKLRLRYCNLKAEDARRIGRQLGSLHGSNKKLVSLDLSGNKLGDDGLQYIAQGLRTNRNLLSLSVSNNEITDVGVKVLSETISQFALTFDEIIERRQLFSRNTERSKSLSPPARRHEPKDRPPSTRSTEKEKVKTSGRDSKNTKSGKKDAKSEKDEKHDKSKGKKDDKGQSTKKPTAAADPSKGQSKSKSAKSGRGSKVPSQTDISEPEVDVEATSPLLERTENIQPGNLHIIGNFVLILLNLARNQITDIGVEYLLNAVNFQISHMTSYKVAGSGIMNIILKGNLINNESEKYTQLMTILQPKDPLNKSKTSDNES